MYIHMSMLYAEILELLKKATNAPSGDNAQPWRFRVADGEVEIWNVANADPTPYNFRERGSIVAIGAVAENIRILATHSGYAAAIRVYPDGPQGCVARILLHAPAASTDALADAIPSRTTNRSPYLQQNLTGAQVHELQEAAKDVGITLRIVDSAEDKSRLARAISINERLIMEHRDIHHGLFRMIRYSRASERRSPGMFIKTMDLPLPIELLFRTALRSWNLVQLLNRAGFSKTIPTQTAPIYESSAAFGALLLAGRGDADFFAIGRALQRVWLAATRCGLAMQPTAAILYLEQRIQEEGTGMFTPEHAKLVTDSYSEIASVFHVTGAESIGMMFRIGVPTRQTVHSYKHEPIVLS